MPTSYSRIPSKEKRIKASKDLTIAAKKRLEAEEEARERDRQENYDSNDSEFEDYEGYVLPAVKQDIVTPYLPYIDALADCPMILGFHAVNAERCCYCPCGPKLRRWRESYNIKWNEDKCKSLKTTPNGLMDHLLISCFYHWMARKYLQILYADFWNPGVGHKALYKVSDANYKAAELAEKRLDLK